jgi:hypothetical protein
MVPGRSRDWWPPEAIYLDTAIAICPFFTLSLKPEHPRATVRSSRRSQNNPLFVLGGTCRIVVKVAVWVLSFLDVHQKISSSLQECVRISLSRSASCIWHQAYPSHGQRHGSYIVSSFANRPDSSFRHWQLSRVPTPQRRMNSRVPCCILSSTVAMRAFTVPSIRGVKNLMIVGFLCSRALSEAQLPRFVKGQIGSAGAISGSS